jgi:hypothetical protein
LWNIAQAKEKKYSQVLVEGNQVQPRPGALFASVQQSAKQFLEWFAMP